MKKCASCSKDLPEAALHCVFCGAKQAPAPAVAPSSVAKTAFGYSANEVLQQLGNQPARPAPQQRPQPVSQQPAPQRAQPPSQPPPIAAQPTLPATPPLRPQPGSQPPPYQQGGLAPSASANAATMYVPGGGVQAPQGYSPPAQGYSPPAQSYSPPAQSYSPPAQSYSPPVAQSPMASPGMGIHSPQQATPAPLPAVPQPYLGAQSGVARGGRPIEPWRDSLRVMMFVWGAVLLATFATPVMTDPMAFQWDAIINGAGSAKIPPLLWAGVGLLSIVFAAIPMATLPRGALATVLGLAGVFVPLAVGTVPEWQLLVPLVGSLALVAGLLVRDEYVDSLLARVLVTVGVISWLVPYLIPQGGQIPLVAIIKILLDGANHMEIVVIALAQIVLAVLCLLAWMPGPASAGAKVFAWAVLLFPIVPFVLLKIVDGDIAELATKQPGALVAWAQGVAYGVLVGYGMATVLGKQLE